MEIEYKLTMNSEQAKTAMKAVELLMRLKLSQYEQIPFALLDFNDNDFCEKRDAANSYLRIAFDALLPKIKKDKEWYRLYNIYQVIRYAIFQAEHPHSTGVDSYPPIAFTSDEQLPGMEWNKYER